MTIDLKVETWPTSRFVPYGRDLRRNGHAVERMIASIRAYGFAIPIQSRGDGEIVDGHLRFMAARKLGLEELPTIVCDTWSEPRVRAFRLLVNRSANWATWSAKWKSRLGGSPTNRPLASSKKRTRGPTKSAANPTSNVIVTNDNSCNTLARTEGCSSYPYSGRRMPVTRLQILSLWVVLASVLAGTRANAQGDDLFHASQNGDLPRVTARLAAKVDVNAKASNGATALMLASGACHPEVVSALLSANADVNVKVSSGAVVGPHSKAKRN